MPFSITFNEEKNELLKATRGVNFEEVIKAIESGRVLDNLLHPSEKYAHQRLLVVEINEYMYAVPCIIDPLKKEIFLKTIYPSRKLTHTYRRKK